MCLVLDQLFVVLPIFMPRLILNWNNNNYNNNCFFDTTICYSIHNRNCLVHTQLYAMLTELLLTCCLLCLPLQSAESSESRRFEFSPSRELYCDLLYTCILILVCPSCLLLLVYLKGVRVIVSVYLWIVHTLPFVTIAFVAFALSVSFTFTIFVLVSFAYCFRVKWY